MEWIVLAGIVALLLIGGILIYNRLVTYHNRVENAFAQIDVQLHRRHDLIPNLVETAKGYMQHERETLTEVIEARNQAMSGLSEAEQDPMDPATMQQLGQAESGLSGALGRLFALSENYPDLKANENMMQLTEELTTTENRVAYARQGYNDAVMTYNTAREVFPSNLIAGWFRFEAATPLEIEEPEMREAPSVSFT
ncbi:MAG: LemA family protein [Thiohalospira sp.]|uniref:LemA family protein n=1 Tax=Thiohalospira sp. TaxID=3080549 RepID=UPI0039802213